MPGGCTPCEGQILRGSLFSEPMRVETIRRGGDDTWVLGLVGIQSEHFRKVTLTLQAVERIASILVLPHPDSEAPDVRQMRPNHQTEAAAMQVVIEHEKAKGRQVYDVHEKNLGYDVTSLDLNSGELRLIEVKGLSEATGMILLTPNERCVAEDRRDCYWLYIVTNCCAEPTFQEPVKDPARFPWHEVKKVQHYWLEVTAMTKPMVVREKHSPYGEEPT